jgi:hypothetical protein
VATTAAPLCVIPTQAKHVVEDPAGVKDKPNVMTEWLDLLSSRGANIVLMHGRYYDNLRELAARARSGKDCFSGMADRIAAVVSESLRRGFGGWATSC